MSDLVNALRSDPQNTDMVRKAAGVSWETAWKYLRLIKWIQDCPPLYSSSMGRQELWSLGRGKIPE